MAMELPKDAKVARDAKHLMQELVSEFICFITSEANDISLSEKRKAISQEDILASFAELDLDAFTPVMEASMEHFVSPEGSMSSSMECTPLAGPSGRERTAALAPEFCLEAHSDPNHKSFNSAPPHGPSIATKAQWGVQDTRVLEAQRVPGVLSASTLTRAIPVGTAVSKEYRREAVLAQPMPAMAAPPNKVNPTVTPESILAPTYTLLQGLADRLPLRSDVAMGIPAGFSRRANMKWTAPLGM